MSEKTTDTDRPETAERDRWAGRIEAGSRHDLRSDGAWRKNDRSAHRRASWLYEDLLN